MIKRIPILKSTTIFNGLECNYGLNPICELNYGNILSRFLIQFDSNKIREYVTDNDKKIFPCSGDVKYTLCLKNCESINKNYKEKVPSNELNGTKERAVSFTLIAFMIPKKWDEGVGFDGEDDIWITGKKIISTDGATWYKPTNEDMWENNGIYSTDFLLNEYENFKNGKESVIISEQHFDHGNEDLNMDITSYVNYLLNGETDHGLCIAFSPILEETTKEKSQYVGFFNNKTNTQFMPFVECRYNTNIMDDRMDFVLGRENKLYLYSIINGELKNLDQNPTCTINTDSDDNFILESQQEGKGIYSVSFMLDENTHEKDTIYNDAWSNIFYYGKRLKDKEFEFVTKENEEYFNMSSKIKLPQKLNPIVSGVMDNEILNYGENRIVKVYFRIPYTNREYKLMDECWYRIYSECGDYEYIVTEWDKMAKMHDSNFFVLETLCLTPSKYHIDIKTKNGDEITIFKNEVNFSIQNNI